MINVTCNEIYTLDYSQRKIVSAMLYWNFPLEDLQSFKEAGKTSCCHQSQLNWRSINTVSYFEKFLPTSSETEDEMLIKKDGKSILALNWRLFWAPRRNWENVI